MKERTPYKYLDYYTFEDADLFFGREEETQKMVGEILSTRLLVLFSPSGSGKTSLINAGVRPALEKLGYKTVYVRLENEPIPSVRNAVVQTLNINEAGQNSDLHGFLQEASRQVEKPLVIFIDQFEEFFIVFSDEKLRQEFIQQVAKIKFDDRLPVFLVFSLREDYFAKLHEFRDAIPSIFQNNANIHLEAFTDDEAKRAISAPAKAFGVEFQKELVDTLVQDMKDGRAGIEPIALQIVCHTLWQNKPKEASRLDTAIYQKCRGTQTILREHVDKLLQQIPWRQQGLMVRIFEALKTRDNTKLYRRFQDLQDYMRIRNPRYLKEALRKLSEVGILRHEQRQGDDWYEFKHDHLVPKIAEWMQARKERITRRRMLYGIAPGMALLLSVSTYLFYQYNTFYLGFVNAEYPYLLDEIAIFRQLDPLHPVMTTGLLDKEGSEGNSIMRSHAARKDLREHFKLGFWQSTNWTPLEQKLNLAQRGLFLCKIGKEEVGIDSLVAALEDKEPDIRSQAATALGNFGQSDERVIAALVAALKNDYSITPSPVIEALVELGHRDKQVLAALASALEDQNSSRRLQAAWTLVKLDQRDERVLAALVAALKEDDLNVRYQAIWALRELGKGDKSTITALLAALKDNESYVSSQAIWALGELGKNDERTITTLLAALKDNESYVRSQVAQALGELGKSDERVLVALVAALKDNTLYARSDVTWALGKLGQNDEQVINMLLIALKDNDWRVRSQSAIPLGELGKSDERILVALFAALKDNDWRVRALAASALRKLSQSDERVITPLLAVVKYEYSNGSSQTPGALKKFGQNDDRVIAELKDINAKVRSEAIEALGELGKTDKQVFAALVAALEDNDSDVRAAAASALGELGKSDERALAALVTALKDNDSNVRWQAIWALTELGKNDERTITALLVALKDKELYVRSQAAEALGELLQSKSEDDLIKLVTHKLSGYRIAGAQALAKKDSLSKRTLDEIDRLQNEDNRPWVKLSAWDAHKLIQEKIESEKKRHQDSQKANQFIQKADSLFSVSQFAAAHKQYESAFYNIRDITRADSLKSAYTQFQEARCEARQRKKIATLNNLKIAFEYNPALRDTLRAEMAKPENDWKILEGNWYLREVLLKK
jgi:HEAT repeat protein